MGRYKQTTTFQHKHCEKCFNCHCRAPIDITNSCLVVNCSLNCGASFHMCKEEEHKLLCPYEKVPCLNAGFGCPFTMLRFRLGKHLEVCPASVVCCSMEWNRWPVSETENTLYLNVMKEPVNQENLDMSLALQDQKLLFNALKMKSIFPELMKPTEELKITESEDEGAVGGMQCPALTSNTEENAYAEAEENISTGEEYPVLTQAELEALAKDKTVAELDKYKEWETIFSKELSSCSHTVKVAEKKSNSSSVKETPSTDKSQRKSEDIQEKVVTEVTGDGSSEKVGLAPWQDGVMERLGKEMNVKEYNMYLVHHGSMLIRFGQISACTPREKDFVYGKLEAQEVKTVRTFKVPTSYCAKRGCVGDPYGKRKKVNKAVDTSDLGVTENDIPKQDIVKTTLLCSLERELKGHVISELVATDGLTIDFGTQTYLFDCEPFLANTTLSDLVKENNQFLELQLQSECVTRRHNKVSSMFTFTCDHFFRRDEFSSHFKNIHADIQSSLNGWFEERCPLSYLGCTYVQRRFCPAKQKARIVYNEDLNTFCLKPVVSKKLFEGIKTKPTLRKRAKNLDSLSCLPFEILQHIAGFLDSFSLNQLAQVSHLTRDVCASLLQERGMVSLKWEKRTYSHGGSSWRARKKVWQFSCLFSTIDSWSFSDMAPMSEHLKVCPFYVTEKKCEPFPLTSMCGDSEQSQERVSLISMFLPGY
ncbi:F-box only protein 40-like [Erpetoichthys calabaricus]|uniref:F-box only protein 40-like n=1 Tax=Erpetoichthys calabaricus TaxID=27687 RepID=UPI0022345A25|nr:F-box only protein 40-like [Erpetoichthys calabaricus]